MTAIGFFWAGSIFQASAIPINVNNTTICSAMSSISPAPYLIVGMGFGFLCGYAILRCAEFNPKS